MSIMNRELLAVMDIEFGAVAMPEHGRFGRLDPDTGNVVEYPMPRPENTMRDFFKDDKGRMWFGEPANDRVGYFYLAK